MSDYRRFKIFCRHLLTPITIMFIPHDNPGRSLNLNVPVIGVLLSVICCFVGAVYFFSMISDAIKYQSMEKQLLDYSRKVEDFNATLSSLKKTEKDLHQLISLKSKEKIFEKVDTPVMGHYAHNKMNAVKVAQKVKQGGVIGYLGSTGSATGSHVQYEIAQRQE